MSESRQTASTVSPIYLAFATAAGAVAVVALWAGISQATSGNDGGSGYQSCSDQVAAWAAQNAPITNGFSNEDIARRTADIQRVAAEALARC